MRIYVVGLGINVEATKDNSVVYLFPVNALNHMVTRFEHENKPETVACYQQEVLRLAKVGGFKRVLSEITPAWAIDRYMKRQVDDLDRLLFEP